MGKNKVLCKVNPEGKYVVDLAPGIDITQLTPAIRVALKHDTYQLHKILPNKIDPLVSLMMVEKVPGKKLAYLFLLKCVINRFNIRNDWRT